MAQLETATPQHTQAGRASAERDGKPKRQVGRQARQMDHTQKTLLNQARPPETVGVEIDTTRRDAGSRRR